MMEGRHTTGKTLTTSTIILEHFLVPGNFPGVPKQRPRQSLLGSNTYSAQGGKSRPVTPVEALAGKRGSWTIQFLPTPPPREVTPLFKKPVTHLFFSGKPVSPYGSATVESKRKLTRNVNGKKTKKFSSSFDTTFFFVVVC